MANDSPEDIGIQPFDAPKIYKLRVAGRLGGESAAWFEDMSLQVDESTRPAQTIIRGTVRDTAELYGLISRVRDLGLTLLSVNLVEEKDNP